MKKKGRFNFCKEIRGLLKQPERGYLLKLKKQTRALCTTLLFSVVRLVGKTINAKVKAKEFTIGLSLLLRFSINSLFGSLQLKLYTFPMGLMPRVGGYYDYCIL